MSDELNLEADRAAFEVWWHERSLGSWQSTLLASEYGKPMPTNWGDGYKRYAMQAWQAARSTAPVSAPLDTQALPPLPEPFCKVGTGNGGLWAERGADGGEPVFTAAQFEQIRVSYAERIAHLERELELAKGAIQGYQNAEATERAAVNSILFGDKEAVEEARRATAQSIDTPEFRQLLVNLEFASRMVDAGDDKHLFDDALNALIAYIDGRTAPNSSKPIAWLLKTGHGNQWKTTAPTGEFADRWIPLVDGRTAGTGDTE